MTLQRTRLFAGSALAGLFIAGSAFAQSPVTPAPSAAPNSQPPVSANTPPTGQNTGSDVPTPATAAQEVVVTGVRASLQSAESIKRNSDNVVDSIVAEDIGKFPDNSLADSLQRITGVQVFRNAGETEQVVVRGLPNVISTLNGREIFSAAGRAFAFQNLPAEAVARVDVYKTSTADLIEGGIAGLINTDLHRPLDFKGLEIAGSFREIHSEIAERNDPIASLLISDRWHTSIGDFGALLDVSYQKQHYNEPAAFDDVRNPVTFNGQTFLAPNVVGDNYDIGRRERPQANFSLQWKPNSELEFYVDGLWDKLKDHHALDFFFSAPGSATGASNINLYGPSEPSGCQQVANPAGQQVQGCELKSGTFTNPYTATSTQAFVQNGYDQQYSVGGKWKHDRFNLTADVSYTDSIFAENLFIVDTPLPGQTLNADTNVDGHVFWNLTGAGAQNQTNPAAYTFNGLFQTWSRSRGDEIATRIDGNYRLDLGPLKTIQTGFRFTEHTASASGGLQISTPPPGVGTAAGPASPASVFGPGYFISSPDELGTAGIHPSLTGNAAFLFDNQDLIRSYYGLGPGLLPSDPARAYHAVEDTYAGYVQASYDFRNFYFPVDGVFGVRVVSTDRAINATGALVGAAGTTYFPVNTNTNDLDALPNASARIHFTDQVQLRLSYAKTATRPDFGSLNPSLSLNPPTTNRLGLGSSGNANLSEIKSNSYDVSAEYYFSKTGLISLAGFYRDISGYIETFSQNTVVGGIPYSISSPQSAGSGHIDGFETAYQQFFDFLPGAFSGFGVQLNYTYIEGQTEAPAVGGGSAVTMPLQNVSKNNGNAVLLYEKYKLSARLAYNYRGSFISAFNLPGAQLPNSQYFKPENHLDFSASYDLGDHVTLTADATNLTRNDLHEYIGAKILPQDIRLEERTFSLGVRFKY